MRQSGWWQGYANDPLARVVAHDFANDIEACLEEMALRFAMPDDIVAVDALAKTADGKLDRAHLPAGEAKLHVSTRGAAPAGSIEEALATLWRDILEVDSVGRNDNFFDLGGDSMRGIQVVAQARRLGLNLALRDLIEHQTIAELAAAADRAGAKEVEPEKARDPESVSGAVPFGVPHRRIIEALDEDYFIERIYVYRFECRRLLRAAPLRRAIEHLVSHHDALRIELRRAASGTTQWNAELARATSDLLWVIDLSHLPDAEQRAQIDRISSKLRDATDLGRVSMLRVALIDLGAGQPQLLLVAVHHAIWDPVTVGIFFDDLRTAYDQAARDRDLRLPPKTSSVKVWAERMEAEGASVVADEVGYWQERLTDEVLVLPLDGSPVEPGVAGGFNTADSLTTRETRVIQQLVQARCAATLEEILLAAIGIAVTKWTGTRKAGINLPHHGRDRLLEGVDVSRTVGWFTSDYPLILDLSGVDTVVDAVRAVRSAVREVPRNGLGYSILRYLGNKPLAGYAHPRIMLNHFGAGTIPTTGPLRFIGMEDSATALRYINSPNAPIQIVSRVFAGALDIFWSGTLAVVKESTVRALAADTVSALRQLIAECENDARGNRVECRQ